MKLNFTLKNGVYHFQKNDRLFKIEKENNLFKMEVIDPLDSFCKFLTGDTTQSQSFFFETIEDCSKFIKLNFNK